VSLQAQSQCASAVAIPGAVFRPCARALGRKSGPSASSSPSAAVRAQKPTGTAFLGPSHSFILRSYAASSATVVASASVTN